jgi:hypothetical protein
MVRTKTLLSLPDPDGPMLALAQRGRFGGPPEDGMRFSIPRTRGRQPHRLRRRRPGRPVHLLRWRGLGRRLESTDGAFVSIPSSTDSPRRPSARSPSPRPIQNRWGWHRRGWVIRDSDMMGKWHLQIVRRREHWVHLGLEETGRSAASSCTDQPGHCVRMCGGTRDRTPTGTRRLPHHRRRQALGACPLRRRETPAAPASRWTRRIPTSSSQDHGKW